MNETLREDVELVLNGENFECHHWVQGNFTVATIQDAQTGKILSVGVSKRNPNCDDDDELRGDTIAFVRAVRMLNGWGEEEEVEIDV